ncbi:DoxX family protein [Methylobacterium sp. WL116]|uniref:DoxX family protein n=1 Tax=Methylobacterium sp. WL116 TaxID=2603889 RepID=UPI0011C7F0AC|nr:DoxX family protein [Methylobacterium sp. WL116]TXM90016.1 DoxX family protein [Methylobacterium sp. WL116]
MNSLVPRLNGYAPYALSLLRAVTGLVFLQHGTQKLPGLPPRTMPAPELLSLAGAAGLLELVGGTLIVLGLFTRPVAFLLSGQMAVGYFLVHAPKSLFPAVNGGDAAILFCFVFLYLVFAGAGPLSVDAARAGRRY